MSNNTKTYLEFDDVLLVPTPSAVSSRLEVDTSVSLSDNLTLHFPLLAAPMVGVVDGKFARKLSDLGGMAFFHRFYESWEFLMNDVRMNMEIGKSHYGISVKVGQDFVKIVEELQPSVLLVDTANGYTERVANYCEEIASYLYKKSSKTLLMAGNVCTSDGVRNLAPYCGLIRFGIGGGSACSTRNVTGVGLPNFTALQEAVHGTSASCGVKIVMDGGIKSSGDFVKAIVAGADLCMAGKLFAECYEAPNEGILYGMASRTHMEKTAISIKSVEGFNIPIEKKHSLEDFVNEFSYGIRSAGTYLSCKTLDDFYNNVEYVRVTDYGIKKGI